MFLKELMYQKGLTTPELDQAMQFILQKYSRISADSADPRTIEDLKRRGWANISPSIKGKDSITNGINWSCPRTGSTNVKVSKTRVSAAGIVSYQMQCADGGYYTIGAKAHEAYLEAKATQT